MKPRRKTSRPQSKNGPSNKEYELEVLEGLEEFALAEAKMVPDNSAASCRISSPGRISLWTTGSPRTLRGLRTDVAVHLVERFQVSRPQKLARRRQMTPRTCGNLVMFTTRRRAFESASESIPPRLSLRRQIPVNVPFQSGYIGPVVYWLTKPKG